MSTEELKIRLISHEGKEKFVYKDTLGYSTIGVGRNIDKNGGKGLSDDEIIYLLSNDISECNTQLKKYDWFNIQDNVRKEVLIELCFNLGLPKLLQFTKMLFYFSKKYYDNAALELLNSKWATQVSKERSDDITYRILHGEYKT